MDGLKEELIASTRRTLAVSRKNARIYYVKPPVIIFGLLFPFVMFLAFAIGRGIEPALLTPRILGVTVLFTASSVGPLIAPWERMMKTYERLLTAPVSLWNIIVGDIISGFLFGLLIALVPLVLGLLFFDAVLISPLLLFFALLLAGLCFSALGSLMSALPTELPANVMMLANLVRFPLLFISGIFIPWEEMPNWVQLLAYLSPLTYAVDLFRWSFGEGNNFQPGVSCILLVLFTALFICWAKWAHQNGIKKMY